MRVPTAQSCAVVTASVSGAASTSKTQPPSAATGGDTTVRQMPLQAIDAPTSMVVRVIGRRDRDAAHVVALVDARDAADIGDNSGKHDAHALR